MIIDLCEPARRRTAVAACPNGGRLRTAVRRLEYVGKMGFRHVDLLAQRNFVHGMLFGGGGVA